jgi:hypothetical protein
MWEISWIAKKLPASQEGPCVLESRLFGMSRRSLSAVVAQNNNCHLGVNAKIELKNVTTKSDNSYNKTN